jgi:hypothetical protein
VLLGAPAAAAAAAGEAELLGALDDAAAAEGLAAAEDAGAEDGAEVARDDVVGADGCEPVDPWPVGP